MTFDELHRRQNPGYRAFFLPLLVAAVLTGAAAASGPLETSAPQVRRAEVPAFTPPKLGGAGGDSGGWVDNLRADACARHSNLC